MNTTRHLSPLLGLALLLAACSPHPPNGEAVPPANTPGADGFVAKAASTSFWSHWSDGKAELNGYNLTQSRYGELRQGRAILVFVTEPFSKKDMVKVDRWDRSDPNQVQAMKLNFIKKFQTGIYDYSVMTSIFVDPSDRFRPIKTSFSMQEWCGNVYEETLFREGKAQITTNSYFEGESSRTEVDFSGNIVEEDTLKITLRGLASEALERPSGDFRMLPSATRRRLTHKPSTLVDTSVSWSEDAKSVTVPAGTFEVQTASYARQDGSTCAYDLEVAYPHRIVAWSCTDGEKAELTGSTRLPYWSTHREGDEKLLGELGLEPLNY